MKKFEALPIPEYTAGQLLDAIDAAATRALQGLAEPPEGSWKKNPIQALQKMREKIEEDNPIYTRVCMICGLTEFKRVMSCFSDRWITVSIGGLNTFRYLCGDDCRLAFLQRTEKAPATIRG